MGSTKLQKETVALSAGFLDVNLQWYVWEGSGVQKSEWVAPLNESGKLTMPYIPFKVSIPSSSSSSSVISTHDCIGIIIQTRRSPIQVFEHLYISLLIEWKKGKIVGWLGGSSGSGIVFRGWEAVAFKPRKSPPPNSPEGHAAERVLARGPNPGLIFKTKPLLVTS